MFLVTAHIWAVGRITVGCTACIAVTVIAQDRARTAWEPYYEEVLTGNPAAEIPMEEWKTLLLHFGPPPELRARVLSSWLVHGTSPPNLMGTTETLTDDDEYYQLMCSTRPTDDVILQVELDLPRTFASKQTIVATEAGTMALKRVLLAHAVHNPSIGYCQCFNSIAGLLLCLPGMHERRAFDVLCCLPLMLDGWSVLL